MGDPDDVAGPAGFFQGRGDAAVAGARTVDAEQVGLPFQKFGGQARVRSLSSRPSSAGSAVRSGYSLDSIWWKPNWRSA